jgi:hypothetical protein
MSVSLEVGIAHRLNENQKQVNLSSFFPIETVGGAHL